MQHPADAIQDRAYWKPRFQCTNDLCNLVQRSGLDDHVGYNLNLPLYIAAQNEDEVTLEKALHELEAAHEHSRQTRAALETELAKWGLSEQEVQA